MGGGGGDAADHRGAGPGAECGDGSAGIGGGHIVGPGEPAPDIPYFAFEEEGFVVIDGDVGVSCYDFALLEQGLARSDDQERLAQSVLEQCEQGGFLTPNNRYVAYPPTQGPQPPVTQAELPATGGPDPLLPTSTGGVLLMGLAVVVWPAAWRS